MRTRRIISRLRIWALAALGFGSFAACESKLDPPMFGPATPAYMYGPAPLSLMVDSPEPSVQDPAAELPGEDVDDSQQDR